jgi:hypothetical protein
MSTALTLGIVAFLYVLPLLLGLFVLRFKQSMKAPQFNPIDPAWLDGTWVARIKAAIEHLEPEGFAVRSYFDGIVPKNAPIGVRCAAVLVRTETGEKAQVAVADRIDDGGKVETVTIIIISLKAGVKRVATMNGDMPGIFVRPKSFIGTALPMLHNAATLYRVHRKICAKHIGERTRGQLPPTGTEVKQLAHEAWEEFAYQARRGLMRETEKDTYGLTWIGAFRGVWKLHPRFLGYHRRQTEAKALRVLAEFDIQPDPAPDVTIVDGRPLSVEAAAFIQAARERYELEASRLRTEWQLDQAASMNADLATGVATYQFADGRSVVADLYVLGSWSRSAQSWEWAWNNPNVPAALKHGADRVRDIGQEIGIAEMTSGFVPAPTVDTGTWMAALAAKALETGGVVPLPPEADADVVLFVALQNLRLVQTSAA